MRKLIGLLIIAALLAAAEHPPPAKASLKAAEIVPAAGETTREEPWKITAYCPCEKCCGRWAHYRGGGWTASGGKARVGITIAVDPEIIPLGSGVYIEGIGWRIAEDTGSAIRGHQVDLFLESHAEAKAFGVQARRVVVKSGVEGGGRYAQDRRIW